MTEKEQNIFKTRETKNRKVLPTQMYTRRQRQMEFCEIEFSLVYLMRPRPTKDYKVRLSPEKLSKAKQTNKWFYS